MSALAAEADPVVVYTMGKVASYSVFRSLRECQITAEHVHDLAGGVENLSRRSKERPRAGHLAASVRVLNRQDRLKFIVLFREPMSRNLSAFFENLANFGHAPDDFPEDVFDSFLQSYDHRRPQKWMENELSGFLGIDLAAVDVRTSHQVFEVPRGECLLLRADWPDKEKEVAIQDFLGKPDFTIEGKHNVGSEKPYSALYKDVRNMAFPSELVSDVLGARWTSAVWSPEEIEAFKLGWATGKNV